MAISGGIKFFYKNRGDIDDENADASVTSGGDTADHARSRRRWLRWESVGSDDTTTEVYTLDFGADYAINRLILNRHNFKNFWVKYWDGVDWAHFTNVVTKEGSQVDIDETGNTKTTNYYEFTEVTTSKIRISIDTTQTADAEKYLYEAIATKELGTLNGYPGYQGTFRRKRAVKEALTGKASQSILGDSFACSLNFEQYPDEDDHSLISTLFGLDSPFLIYPCGGNEDQFRFSAMIGNRLRDIFLVGISGDIAPAYERNVYSLGLNYDLAMVEVP